MTVFTLWCENSQRTSQPFCNIDCPILELCERIVNVKLSLFIKLRPTSQASDAFITVGLLRAILPSDVSHENEIQTEQANNSSVCFRFESIPIKIKTSYQIT